MSRASTLAAAALLCATAAVAGEETAVYRARGADARLFDQYDNDGYSLSVAPKEGGSVELTVRVSDGPLQPGTATRARRAGEAPPPPAADRDAFARELARGSRTREEMVRRVLIGLRETLAYDPDPLRRQDPAAVFSTRRGYCVGFSELAVDLLRRVGISARSVQGILAGEPGSDHYEPAIGGAYHRWIEIYYPERGYVFSDPWTSINGVDARYIPFARRALARPNDLSVETLQAPRGTLTYETVPAGKAGMRVRLVSRKP